MIGRQAPKPSAGGKARAGAESAGLDSSTFLQFHARVADAEANGLQSRDSSFEPMPESHTFRFNLS